MIARAYIVVLALALAPTLAYAEPEPGAARLTRTSSATPAAVPEDHPAWRLYHVAFEALASGRKDEATGLLRQIVTTYPDHPLAKRAKDIIERLDASGLTSALEVPDVKLQSMWGRDRPGNAFSRAELVVAQTLHGIGFGAEVCIVAGCNDPRAIGATIVVGGGVGLGLSLLLTGDGITPGHTEALNTGTLWGAATGFMVSGVINSSEARVIPGSMMVGQVIGLGVGELSWRLTHASSGDISLASSTGFWTGLIAAMVYFTAENGSTTKAEPIFGTVLGTSLAGLAGGAFLADRFPMSRGRVLVIDGGGIVGGLTGLGLALIVRAEDPAPYFIMTGVGAAGGLVLTTILTRNWDADTDRDAMFNIVPTKGGAMVSFSTRW